MERGINLIKKQSGKIDFLQAVDKLIDNSNKKIDLLNKLKKLYSFRK